MTSCAHNLYTLFTKDFKFAVKLSREHQEVVPNRNNKTAYRG